MYTKRKKQQIRKITVFTLVSSLIFALVAGSLLAMDDKSAGVAHPMMKPKMYTKNMHCPNCGMMNNMWARTRHSFTTSEGSHETCSIRCLSDMSQKIGEEPKNVKVAVYMDPDTMIDATQAFYVVGSSSKGTMTMKSKIAFDSKEKAIAHAQKNGGEVKTFAETKMMAGMEADKTRDKIQANRMKKGKIVQATAEDSCAVCGMPPAKYPNNHTQVSTDAGKHHHFCSTKCLINYLEAPEHHVKNPGKTKDIWVTAYNDGDYEYAKGLYYVVGSKKMGPMGPEAFPFRKKAKAELFVAEAGGKVVHWEDLTPAMVMGNMKKMQMGH